MFGFSSYSEVAYSDVPLIQSPDVTIIPTGVSATGAVGTVVIPNIAVNLSGVSATGALGTVSVTVFSNVTASVTGLVALGEVGSPTMWSPVNDAQSATWTSIIN